MNFGTYLFGSHARKENGNFSDKDILHLSNSDLYLQQNQSELLNTDISFYHLDRMKSFFAQGHLFAWHLYLEAQFIEGTNLLASLGRPAEYSLFASDTASQVLLLEDVLSSISRNENVNLTYEAGLLALVLRNISHSLSWFYLPTPVFSKYCPFHLKDKNFPLTHEEYQILLDARIASTRGGPKPIINVKWLRHIASISDNWIQTRLQDF